MFVYNGFAYITQPAYGELGRHACQRVTFSVKQQVSTPELSVDRSVDGINTPNREDQAWSNDATLEICPG